MADPPVANIDHASVLAPPFVLAELEEALVVSMLFNSSRNTRALLAQEVLDADSWQVKRVEEYSESAPRRAVRHRADRCSPWHQHSQHLPRLQAQPQALSHGIGRPAAFTARSADARGRCGHWRKAFGEAPSAVLGKRPR